MPRLLSTLMRLLASPLKQGTIYVLGERIIKVITRYSPHKRIEASCFNNWSPATFLFEDSYSWTQRHGTWSLALPVFLSSCQQKAEKLIHQSQVISFASLSQAITLTITNCHYVNGAALTGQAKFGLVWLTTISTCIWRKSWSFNWQHICRQSSCMLSTILARTSNGAEALGKLWRSNICIQCPQKNKDAECFRSSHSLQVFSSLLWLVSFFGPEP